MRFLTLAVFGLVLPSAAVAQDLPQPQGSVVLTVTGRIAVTNAPGEARFDRAMLEKLGVVTVRTSTTWTAGVKVFQGVPLKAVLDRVGAAEGPIRAEALNDYTTVIPRADLRFGPLLAWRMDEVELTPRDKGPLWVVYPRDAHADIKDSRFDYRWVWQLSRLKVE